MEETIGYEALFSSEEWDSLDLFEEGGADLADIDPQGHAVEGSHECAVYGPPGEHAGNEDRFEVECDRCGDIGSTDTEAEAQALARLHESFIATLVENWSVER